MKPLEKELSEAIRRVLDNRRSGETSLTKSQEAIPQRYERYMSDILIVDDDQDVWKCQ